MLFNSYVFVLIFLPTVLGGFFVLGAAKKHSGAMAWLFAASLFFYGWWNLAYLWLIIGSILFNYIVGLALSEKGARLKGAVLTLGVATNLAVLAYFKYANFFIENVNALTGENWTLYKVILPLGISFFTFQQIAYLIDTSRREARDHSFLHYCLFVSFFPQLIAGPIVHHKEMMPQFSCPETFRPHLENLTVGLTIFIIGLFKKAVLADNIALYSTPVFDAADAGATLTFIEAWGGALAYTFQLYFDFSGYSDMAIGAARMFGIRFPINFFEPYKATSIIEFWRRWHITLSRFLRDYVYISLGGNRRGHIRRAINIMVTMFIGGLWHGAGWTFVVWGGLHGGYLVVANIWRMLFVPVRHRGILSFRGSKFLGASAGWLLTFVCVVVAWVFFRAESFGGAVAMLSGMMGANGFFIPSSYAGLMGPVSGGLEAIGWQFVHGNSVYLDQFYGLKQIAILSVSMAIVLLLPTATRMLSVYSPVIDPPKGKAWQSHLKWSPSIVWGCVLSLMAFTALVMMESPSEFLYFQF